MKPSKTPLMKRTLLIVTLAVGVAACNTKSKPDDQTAGAVKYADTVGFADFQRWKMLNELKESEAYHNQQQQAAAPRRTTTTRSSSGSSAPVASNSTTTTQKKGWSKAAKGAVIGTATGAATGAIVNKRNRAVGGVVGGVVGAGVGYIIGRDMDKKDGRY
ncbi:hypothetical protein JMG10_22550 [Nostoc ellipsosporum NOK]|nr:hypothetical protein [Nostoc ellipsosporum NOK]